jgi:starch-binding outer membrane protein, SusD/RagB family
MWGIDKKTLNNKYMKKPLLLSFLLVMLLGISCTNLVEKPYSEASPQDFFVNDKSVEATIISAYTPLKSYIWSYWNVSEAASDELVTKFHEGNSEYRLINLHEFIAGNTFYGDVWNDCYAGIGGCNVSLEMLAAVSDKVATKPKLIAEARTLRAFYHYLALDMFGNVPILTTTDQKIPADQPTRKAVFEFCEAELKAVIPALPETAAIGRVTKGAALALLNKLYLNAEIYSGTARWNDCISTADAIINTGRYSLEANYYDNFKLNNENSKEAIFQIQFSRNIDLGFPNQNFYMRTLHYSQMPASPWNGFCITAEVYESFEARDPRRQALWIGRQYLPLTWPQTATTGTALRDRRGDPLIFAIDRFPTWGDESSGIRVVKYEPDLQAPGGQGENDYLIFRLADVLLSKAEAQFRLGQKSEALQVVNQVRRRAYQNDKTADLQTLTLKDIYNERGFELYWEGFRRQDMIRFDTFWNAYSNKPDTRKDKAKTILMPIPTSALAQNPNLRQNVGY